MFLLFFCFSTGVFAGGLVSDTSPAAFSSVLHKTFKESKYKGAKIEKWISVQTNIPDFPVRIDFFEFHKSLCDSFVDNGWEYYFLSEDHSELFEQVVSLGNGIYVYRDQSRRHRRPLVYVVDYKFDVIPDIEINFLDRNKLTFNVTIPEVSQDEMFNTFKYRGEPLEEFFKKNVVSQYELRLREHNHYK